MLEKLDHTACNLCLDTNLRVEKNLGIWMGLFEIHVQSKDSKQQRSA